MTTTALVTMIVAWTLITFLMLRFLIKVIRLPMKNEPAQGEGEE